jgi:group I intron endonuclease
MTQQTPARAYAPGIAEPPAGVYRIRNLNNDKTYIGSSINVERRFREHRYELTAERHINIKLQRAWKKHGEGAFHFEVIERIADPSLLMPREQHWLDQESPFYNICKFAHSRLGVKASDETRARISAAKMNPSQETRDRIAAANRARGPEVRARMSEAHKGKKLPAEVVAKCVAASRARSAESRAKTAASSRGRKHTGEAIARMRAVHAGKVIGDEQREKLRQANLGKKHSEETKAKMRASHLRRIALEQSQAV